MLFHLSSVWAITLDIVIWLVIHVGVSVSVASIRQYSFNSEAWIYRERAWEKNGRIYESIFKVKRWKGLLPDGAAVFRSGFRKKRLLSVDMEYVQRFVVEICRAELTHWIILAFSVVFFIWNPWWVGLIMIAYALVVNMPCVITQRYNRIRLKRLFAA
jgi:glycosyl-4,4'-diaponeurosporenoate acyltransferase